MDNELHKPKRQKVGLGEPEPLIKDPEAEEEWQELQIKYEEYEAKRLKALKLDEVMDPVKKVYGTNFLGMTLEEVKKHTFGYRVTAIDGMSDKLTCDYQSGRLNIILWTTKREPDGSHPWKSVEEAQSFVEKYPARAKVMRSRMG